jgi:hypothetical protein
VGKNIFCAELNENSSEKPPEAGIQGDLYFIWPSYYIKIRNNGISEGMEIILPLYDPPTIA